MNRNQTIIAIASSERSKSAFSMVELLVVVGIMSILIAVSVTSIQGLSKGGNITAAGNMLADIGSQARQHAIATNRKTALVVIKSSARDTGTDPTKAKIARRTFCVMDYDPNDTVTPWKMVTRWQSLPAGVEISESDSASFLADLPANTTFTGIDTANKYLGDKYAIDKLGCQIFQPDGSMVLPVSGLVTAKKLRIVSSLADQASNYYEIYFNVYTGTAKVMRPEDNN